MKFLASELKNSKELFYLLIDVKDSDARAKNVDVYNKLPKKYKTQLFIMYKFRKISHLIDLYLVLLYVIIKKCL